MNILVSVPHSTRKRLSGRTVGSEWTKKEISFWNQSLVSSPTGKKIRILIRMFLLQKVKKN